MTIDWWTLGLQTINFLVLIWLLQRFLYRPVLAVIMRRRELAEHAFAEAEQVKAEAEAASQRYQHDRAALTEDRQTLLRQTHRELEEERKRLLDEAREEARQIAAAARADLETEQSAVLATVRSEVADLAVDMATTLLSKFAETSGTGLNAALSQLREQLDALPALDRARLASDVTRAETPLRVLTAEALEPDCKERWRGELVQRLDPEAKLEFVVDPDLIGGAELHFPHAVLSVAWSELLSQARDTLLADESA